MINQLNQILIFKEKKSISYLNNTACMTKDILEIYINKIYKDYVWWNHWLIWLLKFIKIYYAFSHLGNEVEILFVNLGIITLFIPKYLTSICQPFDASINGQIKKAIKKEYILWNAEKSVFSNKNVSKSDVVVWLIKNGEDPNTIASEIIINSFRASGILACKDNVGKYETWYLEILKERFADNEILADEMIKEEVIENNEDFIDYI